MNKNLKTALITLIAAIGVLLIYKVAFIRTVYYEIGGVKIPSKYNILTGTVKPISNYKGKALGKVIKDRKMRNVGLSEEQIVLAQFRWALFEQWADSRPEYRGWQDNPEIFKKAYDAFRQKTELQAPKI